MSELSPRSESIVREGRSALALSDAERRRIRAGLATKLAAAAVVAAPATAAAATAATAGTATAGTATATAAGAGSLALVLKVTLVVGVVGGGGSAAYVALSPGESGKVAAPPAAVTPVVRAGEPPASASARPGLAPPAPASADDPLVDPAQLAAPEVPQAPALAPSPGLAAELSLLDEARQALKGGAAERALRALDHYHRKHPSGQLDHEAALLRAEALCKLGHTAEARALLQRVRERRPDAPGVDAVEASCDL